MRITIHATIDNADGSSALQVVEIGELTRVAGVDPASGLGLFVREANALLRQIQSLVLDEQADEFIRVAAGCRGSGFADNTFALKGGTAINRFVRDTPPLLNATWRFPGRVAR